MPDYVMLCNNLCPLVTLVSLYLYLAVMNMVALYQMLFYALC